MNRRDLIAVLGGAVLVAPLGARAQQKATRVIGFLGVSTAALYASRITAFHQGLAEIGYVEGQNLAIEYRWAEGHYDRLPALAADLVRRNVAVIAATGGEFSARAAKSATSTIPIVFTGGDPVANGLVPSLARPGGNLTGVTIMGVELLPKRLELLSELVPQARVIALLANPSAGTGRTLGDVEDAARGNGLQLHILNASSEGEIDAAFASLAQLHAGALVIANDPFFSSRRDRVIALASRYAVPAIYGFRDFAEAGGLLSYGTSRAGVYRQVGIYAGKILNGAKPADLPVQQPDKFELVINMATAKSLGLTVPQLLLARADEVIE